jgi:hypothetical protein
MDLLNQATVLRQDSNDDGNVNSNDELILRYQKRILLYTRNFCKILNLYDHPENLTNVNGHTHLKFNIYFKLQ